jgi:hypothetical protein
VALENIEQELPDKLALLLHDEPMRRRLGRAAQRTFREKVWSWKERMRLEHELIQEVVRKAHVPATVSYHDREA